MRPRKYYTIPRQNLEAALEDVEQLINFFVIEFQRIVFAENVYATVAVSLNLADYQAQLADNSHRPSPLLLSPISSSSSFPSGVSP